VAEDAQAYGERGFGAIGIWLHKLERQHIDGFWIPEETIPDAVVAAAAAAVRDAGLEVSHLVLTGFYTEPELSNRIAHTVARDGRRSCARRRLRRRRSGKEERAVVRDTRDLAAVCLPKSWRRLRIPASRSRWSRSSPGRANI